MRWLVAYITCVDALTSVRLICIPILSQSHRNKEDYIVLAYVISYPGLVIL